MSTANFPVFHSFREIIDFIISNIKITSKDGILTCEDTFYEEFIKLESGFLPELPFLAKNDLKTLSDHLRLNYYVFPGQTAKVPFKINWGNIQIPTEDVLWKSSYWMDQLQSEKGKGYSIFNKGSERIMAESGSWTYDGEWPLSPEFVNTVYHRIFGQSENNSGDTIGFEVMYGSALEERDARQIIRFYFNFGPDWDTIKDFVQDAFDFLDKRKAVYSIKILGSAGNFYRSDSVIMYSEQKYYFIVRQFIETIYPKYAAKLRKSVPLFTYKMADGLGFAEEPDTAFAQSVGQNRCNMLSSVIAKLAQDSVADTQRTETAVSILLNQEGYNIRDNGIEDFYLNPSSNFPYGKLEMVQRRSANLKPNNNFFLKGALQIGYILSKEAIWLDENTCNWLSYQGEEEVSYRLLDDSLTNGRLGVQVFFNYLYKFAPAPEFKRILAGLKNVPYAEVPYKKGYMKHKSRIKRKPFHFYVKKMKVDKLEFERVVEETFEGLRDRQLVNRWVSQEDADLAAIMIKTHFFGVDRPIKSGLGKDYFCPTLTNGYAGLGYYFLKVYAPRLVPPIEL